MMDRKKDKELEKALVVSEGKALLARMQGKGWRLRIWRNSGWHYQVKNGLLSVTPVSYEHEGQCCYRALLGKYGGMPFWTENRSYADPNVAVRNQIKVARAFVSDMTEIVDKVEKATRR